ncbi:trypsin-like peptidase domain-containing protein [Patescibacteria group bacterium]|nr:trypsin-like peptidase domain-containing protein [Patescibacteria group bacterium]
MDFFYSLLGKLALFATAVLIALGGFFTSLSTYTSVTPMAGETPVAGEWQVSVEVATSTVAEVPPTLSTPVTPQEPTPAHKTAAAPIATPVAPSTPPALPLAPAIDSTVLNTQTREALVNILCTTKAGGSFKPISGSGVLVDSRGVVLTNAHVGQYFLLRDYPTEGNVDCVLRTGSPARAMYRAELLYLPPAWVDANASQIVQEQGTGTGEHDYAFLHITGPTGPSIPFPTTFPFIAMTGSLPTPGDSMLLAAYPAGFLDGQTITLNLYITSAYAAVRGLFTFDNPQQVDLFSIGGTVVSQGGSSGGAVVRAQDGKLAGIIVTSTAATSTAERDLRAITIAHINRSLTAEGQGGLAELLSQNLSDGEAAFASSTAKAELGKLKDAIEHR